MPVLHRIGSHYVMVLRITGRKTGRTYAIPVGYARDDQSVLTTTDDLWWHNLQLASPVQALIQHRWYQGTGQAITEPTEAMAGMRALIAACPRYGSWLAVEREPDGRLSATDLKREIDNGRVLIRITDLRPSR